MQTKLKQMTDSIHNTIYLSDLESALIATPYFNRLHDVYQSSTVYLTYPSNRTKRFEHSLGTMHLTGNMFYYAIANSDDDVFSSFFNQLDLSFESIISVLGTNSGSGFYGRLNDFTKNCLGSIAGSSESDISEIIFHSMNGKQIMDSALNHFIPQRFAVFSIDGGSSYDVKKNAKNAFLYQCILQAIRIVALFHDIGHPPHSHLMEDVLNELLMSCEKDAGNIYDKKRKDDFINNMKKIQNEDIAYTQAYILQPQGSTKRSQPRALHEAIGIKMFNQAIANIVSKRINDISEREMDGMEARIIYSIITVEFAAAILLEQNPFFLSLHKMVDGSSDTDRLDYANRDTVNSGVNWGRIPYRRLLESSRLVIPPESKLPFAVAFPKKMTDDIDDIFEIRFKIFARINYHHRTVKTATMLKTAVKEIAMCHLENKVESAFDGIKKLWEAPANSIWGDRGVRIIATWNDSWLISCLYDVLDEIEVLIKAPNKGITFTKERLKRISYYLKEVLLNEKKFYSLYKRGSDVEELFRAAKEKADLTSKAVSYLDKICAQPPENINIEEKRRIYDVSNVISLGDMSLIQYLLPINMKTAIEEELNRNDNIILDYFVMDNPIRNKNGLPGLEEAEEDEAIYLYNDTGNSEVYNVENLRQTLTCLTKTCAILHVFVCVKGSSPDEIQNNLSNIKSKLIEIISVELGNVLKNYFEKVNSF